MTGSLDDITPKTTEQNLIVRAVDCARSIVLHRHEASRSFSATAELLVANFFI